MGVKLKIDSKHEWLELCWELTRCGLLKDVSVRDINLSEDAFPMEIPVKIDGLVNLLSNPLVKPYKKMIDMTLRNELAKIIGG